MILNPDRHFNTDINFAFLSDRLVLEACQLIEHGVATPSSLFATNSLVQAVVLHDFVVVGLTTMVGSDHPATRAPLRQIGSRCCP